MGKRSKFPKFWTLEIQIFKIEECPENINNTILNGQLQGRTYVYANMHVCTTWRSKHGVFSYLIWFSKEKCNL